MFKEKFFHWLAYVLKKLHLFQVILRYANLALSNQEKFMCHSHSHSHSPLWQ